MSIDLPDATIGVVGGGQLGRMMGEAAAPLGVDLIVLDPTPDAPAKRSATDQICAEFDDTAAITALAEEVDVLTYEIELADPAGLRIASDRTGTPVHPDPDTLELIQDKLTQNRHFAAAGIPVPEFEAASSLDSLEKAADRLGPEVMVKARSGGYDGRGNLPLRSSEESAEVYESVGPETVVEEFVDFERELSVIGVVGAEDRRTYMPAENVHKAEILRESIAPARTAEQTRERAIAVAHQVLDVLDGRGVYGIELFESSTGEILVNEVAPRPHNSGHWTIEGAVTSQFEQHVRAVLGFPLGSTGSHSPTVSANILADGDRNRPAHLTGFDATLREPTAHLHWYGKQEARPLRKMGHVTLTAEGQLELDREELLSRARALVSSVSFEP